MVESPPALRAALLGLLVLQTSATVLLLRYSRSNRVPGELYLATTVVFLTEVAKYLLGLLLLGLQAGPGGLLTTYMREVVGKPWDTATLAIPASLYVLQNNLLILALTNLDAATYQVTYQMKILTTAGCSVVLLGRRLGVRQVASLVVLVVGVAMVQTPTLTPPTEAHQGDAIIGLLAVVTACFSSGFAGVFYERLVKQSSQTSLVIRNLQLGLFSLAFSLTTMLLYSSSDILALGMFHGYSASVFLVILLQACGGLVVAATIKYADNILKGFATSISIILSSIVSWLLLGDLSPGLPFLLGTCLVLAASLLYGLPSSPAAPSRPKLPLHV